MCISLMSYVREGGNSYLRSFENGNATTGRLLLEVSSCVVNALKKREVCVCGGGRKVLENGMRSRGWFRYIANKFAIGMRSRPGK